MKRLPKITIALLAAVVFAASVLCCCSEAMSLSTTKTSCCDGQTSGKSAPLTQKAQCDCHKEFGLLTQPAFELKSSIVFTGEWLTVALAQFDFDVHFSNNTALSSLHLQGPPQDFSVPLYLKNSILRI